MIRWTRLLCTRSSIFAPFPGISSRYEQNSRLWEEPKDWRNVCCWIVSSGSQQGSVRWMHVSFEVFQSSTFSLENPSLSTDNLRGTILTPTSYTRSLPPIFPTRANIPLTPLPPHSLNPAQSHPALYLLRRRLHSRREPRLRASGGDDARSE